VQILMTEAASESARAAALRLEAEGHTILTCGDGAHIELNCAALRGEQCPLARFEVDVALHLERSGPPTLADEGVLCALRHFVPLVVVSRDPSALAGPFDSSATAICELDDLEEALAAATTASLVRHGAAAEQAANRVLESAGREATWRADVRRTGRRLRVELVSDAPVERELCERSSVLAAGAVRQLDGVTPTLDIIVTVPDE
jgi:hypothetical protein